VRQRRSGHRAARLRLRRDGVPLLVGCPRREQRLPPHRRGHRAGRPGARNEARRPHHQLRQRPTHQQGVRGHTTRAFTEWDETSVQRLADHAGLAIQNARQFRGHAPAGGAGRHLRDRACGGRPTGGRRTDAGAAPGGRAADGRAPSAVAHVGRRARHLRAAVGGAAGLGARGRRAGGMGRPPRAADSHLRLPRRLRRAEPGAVALRPRAALFAHSADAGRGRAGRHALAVEQHRPCSRADEEFVAAVAAILALRLTRPTGR
jgi:hypothetical protein